MLDALPLVLSLLLSRRELRFEPIPEQAEAGGCGLAVARALLGEEAQAVAAIPPLDLGRLEGILRSGGLAARGYFLDLPALDSLLDRGLSPIVVHYARPAPHWALLLGRSETLYQLGDPARGLEILCREDLAFRYGGAALVVDPEGLPEGFRERAREAGTAGLERWAALSALSTGEASRLPRAGGSGRGEAAAGKLGLVFSGEVETSEGSLRCRGSLRLEAVAEAATLGLEWPLVGPRLGEAPSPARVAPTLSFGRAFLRWPLVLALSFGLGGEGRDPPPDPGGKPWTGSPVLSLGAELSRIADPLALGLAVRLVSALPLWPGTESALSFGLSATEAVSERFFLRLACRLEVASGGSRAPRWDSDFEAAFAMSLETWSGAFGLLEGRGRRILRLESAWEFGPGSAD